MVSQYGSVTGAGVAEITNQMEYDDEVAYEAVRKIYDLSRGHDPRPWCLTVSFTHPHDPYVARKNTGICTKIATTFCPISPRWIMTRMIHIPSGYLMQTIGVF